jgi:hypothetical protein
MALAYIPADGGPRSLQWPLGSSDQEFESPSIPGPTGVWLPGFLRTKSLRVLAIDFASDHSKKMTDKGYFRDTKNGDFEAGGDPFPEEWTHRFDPEFPLARPYPLSHTGGRHVDLYVAVKNDYPHSVEASLTGSVTGSEVADGMQFVLAERTFPSGTTVVRVISNQPLRMQIQATQFEVKWEFTGPRISSGASSDPSSIHAPPQTTTNELFVTLGEPRFNGQELTYERMAHTVQRLGALGAFDPKHPHQFVDRLVKSVGFDGRVTRGTWWLAINPQLKADCITISKYVAALLQMIGIRGEAKPVIIYARPKKHVQRKELIKGQDRLLSDLTDADVELVEESSPYDPDFAGLNGPAIIHPRELWRLTLLDDSNHFNNFEGCIKFTPLFGATKWYPGGGGFDGVTDVNLVLPTVFKTLSWIDNDDKPMGKPVLKYR